MSKLLVKIRGYFIMKNKNIKKELSHQENIEQAALIVKKWPSWKIENMKLVFSEPDINIPCQVRKKTHKNRKNR